MKVLFLADINSPHIQKWVAGLSPHLDKIGIFSFSTPLSKWYLNHKNVSIVYEGLITDYSDFNSISGINKLKYLSALKFLKRSIDTFKPDVLHAHYASSYGLLGALSGFHPYIISVWGSDIFEFPYKSFIHKTIIKFNLKKADMICSTGHVMAEKIRKYTTKEPEILAFGINTDVFKKSEPKLLFKNDDLVIGSIKSLEKIYGIDVLIKAFKIVKEKLSDRSLKLLIVGEGTQRNELERLVDKLTLRDRVLFIGRVNYDDIVAYHNRIDIFAMLSHMESFGVAALEASACQKPVVATNVGGIPEVVENEVTGFLIEPNNIIKAAKKIQKLIVNEDLRIEMGKKGREKVIRQYNLNKNVEHMLAVYKMVLHTH